jgi:Tfp pilus assembly protein FimT
MIRTAFKEKPIEGIDLDKGVHTYNIYQDSNKKNIHILSNLNNKINERILPNQKQLNKEYLSYRNYWRNHYKQKMINYNSDKARYKKDKLTKQEFVSLVMANKYRKVGE